jgi:tRNA A-37 threonylcarbamoyl transferase component Bud32
MDNPVNTGEAMVQCPICKKLLPAGSRFCPNDGTPLTETAALSGVPTPSATFPSFSDIELPTIVGGRYRLVAVRGGGGMARVYQAVDQTLEREVAVKLISPQLRSDPEFDARFQREARIASKLQDPHIVVVHDFGIDPAHGPYLVMEYLQGQSLREHLQTKGPLPYKATLQLAGQLLLALIHAHGQGIIHRDIKPDNIFLVNISGVRLHVRVLDFGIARIMNRDAGNAQLTSPGAVLGTPRYMSPEQLAGAPLDARSDLYSAALVIYEALTGQLPHTRSKNLAELCPEVPPQFQALISQCLEADPDKRPSSALEAFLQLQEMGKASGVLLLPAGAMERLAEARRQAQGLRASGDTNTTLPHVSPGARRWRRLLLGLVAAVVVAGLLMLVKYLFFTTGPAGETGPESLLGIKIGDEQQGVVDRLKLTRGGVLDPFATPRKPAYLGHALRVEDLSLEPGAQARLDVRRTAEEDICVLFVDGKVRAVVLRKPASGSTSRGFRLGGLVGELYDRYPEESEAQDVKLLPEEDPEKRRHVLVHRYDRQGIAFEIYGSKVAAITLYPPRGQ